ncbi:uncharacterized protein [Ptychodera flava]|uniref:uncharacterized protein n=1 Tax=Ptychodera flava TaxID=63121 RepID=UPI00396A7D4C
MPECCQHRGLQPALCLIRELLKGLLKIQLISRGPLALEVSFRVIPDLFRGLLQIRFLDLVPQPTDHCSSSWECRCPIWEWDIRTHSPLWGASTSGMQLIQPQPHYGTLPSQLPTRSSMGAGATHGAEDKAKLERENAALSEQLRMQQLQLEKTLDELGQAQSRLSQMSAPNNGSARSTPLSNLGRPQRQVGPTPYNRPEELPGPSLDGWAGQNGNSSLTDSYGRQHSSTPQRQREGSYLMDSPSDYLATTRSASSSSGREPNLTSASIPGVSPTDSLTQEQRDVLLAEMKYGILPAQ